MIEREPYADQQNEERQSNYRVAAVRAFHEMIVSPR